MSDARALHVATHRLGYVGPCLGGKAGAGQGATVAVAVTAVVRVAVSFDTPQRRQLMTLVAGPARAF